MRKKNGQFIKGSIPHNKGDRKYFDLELLKKEYLSGKSTMDLSKEFNSTQKTVYNRLKEQGVEMRKSLTKEQKNKISRTMKERGIEPKIKNTKAWNKDITGQEYLNHYKDKKVWNSGIKTGYQNWKKRNFDKEVIRKIKESRFKQIFPLKDTKIEKKIQDFLNELKIKYERHKLIEIRHRYQCDIFIPKQDKFKKDIIIECDGCYWHGCPKCNQSLIKKQIRIRDRDNRRNKEIKGKNIKIIRLWEHDIKNLEIEEFKKLIDI